MGTIVIYRQRILPASETFIKAQAGSIRSSVVRFVGLEPAQPSLDLPTDPILLCRTRSPLSRVYTKMYNFAGFGPRFHKRVKELKPALIHAHFAPDGASAMSLASALGVPLVVTLHGYDVTTHDAAFARTLAGKLYLRLRRRLFSQASLFICVSEFIRAQAIEKGFPERKLRVHYIGIDRSLFQPVEKPRRNRILFVGRLVEKKGCAILLRAMRLVSDSIPEAELVIVGNGPLRSILEQDSQRLQLKCKFMGSQPAPAVRDLMAESNILCLPSITAEDGDSEGLGMVLLEAQAMGRPVVGFRSGGIPEAVRDGETGLLASPSDEKELAAHLKTLLSNEPFWNKASERAVAWVSRRFDLATQTRELERLYGEVMPKT